MNNFKYFSSRNFQNVIRVVTYGNKKVWLFFQQLHKHVDDSFDKLLPSTKFFCYFKFSEPTVMLYGELVNDLETELPIIFNSVEEAEAYATEYLSKRYFQKREIVK